MRIPRRFGVALATLVGLGAFFIPSATAQALPLQPGQLQICTTEATPAGYYTAAISQEALPACPNTYGVPASPGYSKVVAPVPPPVAPIVGCYNDGYQAPSGYATTAINNAAACGYFNNINGGNLTPGDTVVWTPLTGGPMDVCSSGGIPPGYVYVPGSARDDGGRCSYDPYGVPFSNGLITITPAV